MALSAGARFGPYEIVSPLGAGGMGEVYRARDQRLQRDVAIKVLPEALAADPERIARLGREARTLAALNDPNIAAIFGFEESGGRHALVLELVDGPTLAERLARGPLPVPEAIAIAKQIAKAIDAAHRNGIVHRDLKPANIKVRDDGTVKVLDFGLAKAFEETPSGDAASSPTITSPAIMTAAGVIIGSAAYMAPEQARGFPADHRGDIWAFGCVLYEMLTSRRAFNGAGVTDTLAAVLRGDPDWSLLPPDLPPAIRTLLMRCLEKDRGERVQDISIALFVLTELRSGSSIDETRAISGMRPAAHATRVAWIAGSALAGLLAGAGLIAWKLPARETATGRTARFPIGTTGSDALAVRAFGSLVAISPDGSTVVYPTLRNGVSQLMRRRLDRVDAEPIAGTEGAVDPFFSPDGREIGFLAAGELRRVSVDGGPSAIIWRGDPTFDGAAWRPDGTIIFSHDVSLHRINVNGGEEVKIASPDGTRDEVGFDRPSFLPGGHAFLYSVEVHGGRNRVAVWDLETGHTKTLIEDGFGGQYLAPGFLVYGHADRLMAVPFDPASLTVTGAPVELEPHAFMTAGDGVSNIAAAADGTAVFVAGRNPGMLGRLAWLNPVGSRLSAIADQPLERPRNVRLSPDGQRLAVIVGGPAAGNVWVYDLRGAKPPIALTFRDHNTFPIWSPDGRQIAFMNMKGAVIENFVVPADGSTVQLGPLSDSALGGATMDWSPRESAVLLYRETKMWLIRPPDPSEREWIHTPFPTSQGRFSPDGQWIAYTSTQTGLPDVWVRSFAGSSAPIRVSSNGGHEPVWSRDGTELYFTVGSRLMASRVTTRNPEPRFDPPHLLFEGRFVYDLSDPVLRFYDVAPDGRFVVVEPIDAGSAAIVVSQHWAEELKARLPK